MDGGDGKAVDHLFERDLGRGVHVLGGELGLAENQRQRHREVSGVSRADELLGIGAGLALEAAAEAIGIFLERAALVEMALLSPLIPPCQTADRWVSSQGSPCRGQVRSPWVGVRDMGSLR